MLFITVLKASANIIFTLADGTLSSALVLPEWNVGWWEVGGGGGRGAGRQGGGKGVQNYH